MGWIISDCIMILIQAEAPVMLQVMPLLMLFTAAAV